MQIVSGNGIWQGEILPVSARQPDFPILLMFPFDRDDAEAMDG